jgi:FtsZ-binding cell division protein ZapB
MKDQEESHLTTLKYYEHNMIPQIKESMQDLQTEMKNLKAENDSLTTENQGLKGSLTDKLRHYERDNRHLKSQIEAS